MGCHQRLWRQFISGFQGQGLKSLFADLLGLGYRAKTLFTTIISKCSSKLTQGQTIRPSGGIFRFALDILSNFNRFFDVTSGKGFLDFDSF